MQTTYHNKQRSSTVSASVAALNSIYDELYPVSQIKVALSQERKLN